ncbi:MAG: hypothetical protein R3D25_05680 [Geminicoccaceae bacterium]
MGCPDGNVGEAVAVEIADDGGRVPGPVAGADAVEADEAGGLRFRRRLGIGIRHDLRGQALDLQCEIVEVEVAQVLKGDPGLARRLAPGRDRALLTTLVERVGERVAGIAVRGVEDVAAQRLAARRVDQGQMVGVGEAAARGAVAAVDEGEAVALQTVQRILRAAIGDQEEPEAGAGGEVVDAVDLAHQDLAAERRPLGVGDDDPGIDEAAVIGDPVDPNRVAVAGELIHQRQPEIAARRQGQHRRVGAVDQLGFEGRTVGARRQRVEHRGTSGEIILP